MKCNKCSPRERASTIDPFIDEKWVIQESHEGVALARCVACDSAWLHVWVEIYDDMWAYWARLEDEEVIEILGFDTQSDIEPFLEKAKAMVRKAPSVLEKHPIHGLGWGTGEAAMLDGAPW